VEGNSQRFLALLFVFEIYSNRALRTRIDETDLLSRRGRLADFLMASAFCLKFVLKTLGKSDAIFRSRSVESNSNRFVNLTNAVGPIPVMAPRVDQVI
jgi:hypothetical protein